MLCWLSVTDAFYVAVPMRSGAGLTHMINCKSYCDDVGGIGSDRGRGSYREKQAGAYPRRRSLVLSWRIPRRIPKTGTFGWRIPRRISRRRMARVWADYLGGRPYITRFMRSDKKRIFRGA